MKITNVVLLVVICIDASALTLEGKAIGVHDGDTMTILDANKRRHKIRLAQIDAPEISQAFGNESERSLSDIVLSRSKFFKQIVIAMAVWDESM